MQVVVKINGVEVSNMGYIVPPPPPADSGFSGRPQRPQDPSGRKTAYVHKTKCKTCSGAGMLQSLFKGGVCVCPDCNGKGFIVGKPVLYSSSLWSRVISWFKS